jgi:1-acyl-sn-glycerol-3-phosphate acyltransferase
MPSRVVLAGHAGPRRRPARIHVPALPVRAARVAHLLAVLLALYLAARFGPPLSAANRSAFARRWAHRLLRTLRVDVRARGHLPAFDAPLLLVANHVSWLDCYALNTLSAARFVAKSEVRGWPLVGEIATRFGTFFLRRGCYRAAARAVAALAEALCAAEPVAVFPEGTTTHGETVLRFYPAMFQAAVLSGARVQPVAIRYRAADGQATPAAAYVGDMSVLTSVRQLVREPLLTAELIFCAPLESTDLTRKELAAAARAAILTALQHGGLPQRDDIRTAAA